MRSTEHLPTSPPLAVVLASAVALLLSPISTSLDAQTTSVLVGTGDPVPGGNGEFLGFYRGPDDNISGPRGAAVLNDAGEVGFAAYLRETDAGAADDSGVFLWRNGQVVEVVREGEVPPDGDGIFNRQPNYYSPALLDDGRVGHTSFLQESDSGDFFETAVYFDDLDTERIQIARSHDPVPMGDVLQDVFAARVNRSGEVGFLADVEDPNDPLGERALYRGSAETGELVVIAREGQNTPDGTASYEQLAGFALNDAGQLAFPTTLDSMVFSDEGIYRADGETTTEIARKQDPVPGSADETLSSFGSGSAVDMDEEGLVVYHAIFTDSYDQAPASGAGYLSSDGTSTEVIVRTGDPAPDGNGTFGSFQNVGTALTSPDLNERGQIAFWGLLPDAANAAETGFFLSDGPGTPLRRIARRNQVTPDGEYVFGITYRQVETIRRAGDPWLNDEGQAAFYTNVHPIDGSPGVQGGIYFWDESLGILEVAQTGKPMMGGTLSRVSLLSRLGYAAEPTRSPFNDLGQIVYAFVLEDGREGIARWTPPGATTDLIFADGFEDGLEPWSSSRP